MDCVLALLYLTNNNILNRAEQTPHCISVGLLGEQAIVNVIVAELNSWAKFAMC